MIDFTFTSEEAINNLGALKFSQSNRMPDPKDPSRIVTTTTTTTFSMARDMARSVCQRFMDARFIEATDQKPMSSFPLRHGLFQLTPKGINVLERFCQRNGINQSHVMNLLRSSRNTMQLVTLERDPATDRISHDRSTIEVIFRRFVGTSGPNVKSSTSSSDSDSLTDYGTGLVGVKMAGTRKIQDRVYQNTFTGKAASDWLMDCCTTVERRETFEICTLFIHHGLLESIIEDKGYIHNNHRERDYQPTKNSVYGLTTRGQQLAGWIATPEPSGTDGRPSMRANNRSKSEGKKETNTNRLESILQDAALRLLFREYLRDTHCEENMAFYLDVAEFTGAFQRETQNGKIPKVEQVRETLAAAYGKFCDSDYIHPSLTDVRTL
jgi:GTPase-activating protein SST2